MNGDTLLSAQVAAALGGLGTTAVGIAEALENKGVKATRGRSTSCALSVYVREQFPECNFVSTGTEALHVGLPDSPFETVPLTLSQRAFVATFDAGAYPNLVQS